MMGWGKVGSGGGNGGWGGGSDIILGRGLSGCWAGFLGWIRGAVERISG